MNKKQLIVAWIMIGLICLIIIFPPRIVKDPETNEIYARYTPLEEVTNKRHMKNIRPDWEKVFGYSMHIILLGSLLIYTLRGKKK